MDAALRAAERTYASVCPAGAGVTWSMIEAARDELNRQRQRAGLVPLCACCGDEPSAHVDGSGDAVCGDCYASNLRGGHREGCHDEEPCDDCSLCPRAA